MPTVIVCMHSPHLPFKALPGVPTFFNMVIILILLIARASPNKMRAFQEGRAAFYTRAATLVLPLKFSRQPKIHPISTQDFDVITQGQSKKSFLA